MTTVINVHNHYHYHQNHNVYIFHQAPAPPCRENWHRLGAVEAVPLFGGQDALHFPVMFPSGELSKNLPSSEIHKALSEGKWTHEKKNRLKYGFIIGLSCLALPILFPVTIHYGKKLSASRNKGDLEKTSERTKIQEKIRARAKDGTLSFAKMRKQYTPDEMERYQLLDKVSGTDEQKNKMYRQYRELCSSIVTTKSFKRMHKRFVDSTYKQKVGKALSSYRWKMAGFVSLEVLSVVVTILAAIAAGKAEEDRRPVAAAVNIMTAVNGTAQAIETMGDIAQLKLEYNHKIRPWDKWKKQRYQQIDNAYKRAQETQNLFFKEIVKGGFSAEIVFAANDAEPSAPPLPDEPQASAPPLEELPRKLYPTIEVIDSKNVVVCPITQEPLAQNKGSSLACGHVFETEAITTWLKKQPTCPCCRGDAKESDLRTI